eukprot:COSAG02_NODE_5785_length_4036_cov_3.068834_2_plen_115_part_00
MTIHCVRYTDTVYRMLLEYMFVAELCVLRTFGGVNFSLVFICAQSASEFLWDGLHASIEFPVVPKHAQYARFGGECVASQEPTEPVKFMGRTQELQELTALKFPTILHVPVVTL